jgi:hypothetical protein
MAEAARVIQEQEPAPISTHDHTLRGDVETIVAKALEKEKERRYRGVAELSADDWQKLFGEGLHPLVEEVLVLDDLMAGQNTFTGADGNPLNGTPHWQQILEAFQELLETSVPFIRGDADGSGEIDLSDAINILLYLFLGIGFPDCLSALDADGNGFLELTDAIAVLEHLFITGQPLPPPFPACAPAEDSPFWCKKARCP